DMCVGNEEMLHYAKLLVESESARQSALEVWILLPLVQIATKNRVLVGNAMVDPGLKIMRLGKVDASLLAKILVGEKRGVPEVGVGPKRQVLLGHVVDSDLRNDVISKRLSARKRIAHDRRLTREIALLPCRQRYGRSQIAHTLRRESGL